MNSLTEILLFLHYHQHVKRPAIFNHISIGQFRFAVKAFFCSRNPVKVT